MPDGPYVFKKATYFENVEYAACMYVRSHCGPSLSVLLGNGRRKRGSGHGLIAHWQCRGRERGKQPPYDAHLESVQKSQSNECGRFISGFK